MGSLNWRLSEPNMRSMAAEDPLHSPLSNATKARHQQRQRRHSSSSVLPSRSSASDSAERRPRTAGSTASDDWESEGDILAESLQGKLTLTATQGACTSLGSSLTLLNKIPFFQICLRSRLGTRILPRSGEIRLCSVTLLVDITMRIPDIDRLVSSAVILFTLRPYTLAFSHLRRPSFPSLVPWLPRTSTTPCPLIRLRVRPTRLFLFPGMQSESVPADVTTRLSVSITALGQAVRKATLPLITSTPTSSCSATELNELRPVRFTALFTAIV